MRTFLVDAFTNKPYTGNPAAVCILEKELPEELMQKIAMEINLSETAFLFLNNDNSYNLRWFTPKAEVRLCGHATLASAHVLLEQKLVDSASTINFHTKSGILTAVKKDSSIELNFPQQPVNECPPVEIIEQGFNIKPLYIGKDERRYLIEISSIDDLKNLKPNFGILQNCDLGAFTITCKGDNNFDFYSRFFAPIVGVNEDPVTGSAHCYLAPYWAKKLGKNILKAYQASERGGEMECELIANNRVLLRG